MSALSLFFNPKEDSDDINEIVLKSKKQGKTNSNTAVYMMLSDSLKKNEKVFKSKKAIKSRKDIPKMLFL